MASAPSVAWLRPPSSSDNGFGVPLRTPSLLQTAALHFGGELFFDPAGPKNGLNRYINNPWAAVDDMVMSRQ